MQYESVWEKYLTKERKAENPEIRNARILKGDLHTDVLIVGAGIAGILCAYRLKKAGVSVIVLEKGSLLEGVTRNTTAKITAQHGLIYKKIQKSYGLEKAGQYYEINEMALREYQKLSEDIPCDMEEKTAYIYSGKHPGKLEQEAEIYEKLAIPYLWQEEPPLPVPTGKALGMKNQAQFHPMKLLARLAGEVEIYENTEVLEIAHGRAITNREIIRAEKIILATHFPMVNIPGAYFLKMYQERSYALAIEGGAQLPGMYRDENKAGLSFRNYRNYLIVGGYGHKTGTKCGGFLRLKEWAQETYPGKRIPYIWGTQDCMSLDGIPYIGQHSRSREQVFVATGFNKWGMTSAMAAAIVLEELITKGKSEYEELFSPKRSMLHPQIVVNFGSALGNLVRPGKRCTHMGCALRWNHREQTWDCPCHGSRFEENGEVLENPAKKGW